MGIVGSLGFAVAWAGQCDTNCSEVPPCQLVPLNGLIRKKALAFCRRETSRRVTSVLRSALACRGKQILFRPAFLRSASPFLTGEILAIRDQFVHLSNCLNFRRRLSLLPEVRDSLFCYPELFPSVYFPGERDD
jgi:hypothetical protein